jgi:hypothetical protein
MNRKIRKLVKQMVPTASQAGLPPAGPSPATSPSMPATPTSPAPLTTTAVDPLMMGEAGDWKSEGYKIKHGHPRAVAAKGDAHPSKDRFYVEAHDKHGKPAGSAQFAHKNGHIVSEGTMVPSDHRRKGLATAMYAHAEKISGKKTVPDDELTPGGEALWRQKARPFGKGESAVIRAAELIKAQGGSSTSGILRNMITAGAIGAATLMGPSSMAESPKADTKQPTVESPVPDAPKHTKDDILDAIKMVESSGGKNLQHEKITNPKNINYGTYSRSAYGIMPVTAKDIISKNRGLRQKYGHLIPLEGDDFHKAFHQHPELDRKLASHYYDHAASHFGHDPAKIGFAWLNGITGTKRYIRRGNDPNNHWHVQKILNALQGHE